MLPPFIKSMLVDKLTNGFVCFIEYVDSSVVYNRPFKCENAQEYLMSSAITLFECAIKKPISIPWDNVLSFSVFDMKDREASNKRTDELLKFYREYENVFDYLNGDRYFQVLFQNMDDVPMLSAAHKTKIKLMVYLNFIRSVSYVDYKHLMEGRTEEVSRFRMYWKKLIMKKYDEIITSLDKEMAESSDQSVKDEVNSIKDIIKFIPKEIDEELTKRTTHQDISNYWPTLLLPKPNPLDTSNIT